jgi:hypothetical protein
VLSISGWDGVLCRGKVQMRRGVDEGCELRDEIEGALHCMNRASLSLNLSLRCP